MPFIWTEDEVKPEFPGNAMSWSELIEYACDQLAFQNRSPHHIYDVRRALINASAWFEQAGCPPAGVNVRNATTYLSAFGQTVAPISVKQRAIKLKWLFRLAYRHELLEKNKLENLIAPSVPSRKTKAPTLDEIQRIVAAMNRAWTKEQQSGRFKSAAGRRFFLTRDPLMVYMLAECGLRIGELVKLEMEDVSVEDRTITLRNTKNGSDRVVPMSRELVQGPLYEWLLMRSKLKVGNSLLFITERGGPVATQSWGRQFNRYVQLAGIDHRIRRHDFRHQASRAHDKIDREASKEILGHFTDEAHKVYSERDLDRLRDVHEQANPIKSLLVERNERRKAEGKRVYTR